MVARVTPYSRANMDVLPSPFALLRRIARTSDGDNFELAFLPFEFMSLMLSAVVQRNRCPSRRKA